MILVNILKLGGLSMKREEAKNLLPIIQAFAEGKVIQYKDYDIWIDCGEALDVSTDPSLYRIKPEPKYHPFQSQEECWNEMHNHPDFGWLYYKEKGYYVSIDAMGDRVGMNGQKFAEAYSDYTFTDGAPFGTIE